MHLIKAGDFNNNVAIIAINSNYIHTPLAAWYLKESLGVASGDSLCGNDGVASCAVLEFTINDNYEAIRSRIAMENARILAFSCYIWNIDIVFRLISDLKKINSRYIVILGGPEASFGASEIFSRHQGVDFIISGEGEQIFPRLIHSIREGTGDYRGLGPLSYRDQAANESVVSEVYNMVSNLDEIASPFRSPGHGMLRNLKSRLLYYEASRGCPFSCAYCVSSSFDGVRHFSIERIEKDLESIADSGAATVKFIDRTFNGNQKRALEILRIVDRIPNATFHFEMAPELFDEDLFYAVSQFEKGRLQFEIGIQSLNAQTLESVQRKVCGEMAIHNIQRLIAIGNAHVHLDLIAGLPHETLDTFISSFDKSHRLCAHRLQCGFLKMLKGTRIRKHADVHGYAYSSHAPYEVLKSKYMSFPELNTIKAVERTFNALYNSKRFTFSTLYASKIMYNSPFEFYRSLSSFMPDGYSAGLSKISHNGYYTILAEFCREKHPVHSDIFEILLMADFYCSGMRGDTPPGVFRVAALNASGNTPPGFLREAAFDARGFLKDANTMSFVCKMAPELAGLSAKEILKKTQFVPLPIKLDEKEMTSAEHVKYLTDKTNELRMRTNELKMQTNESKIRSNEPSMQTNEPQTHTHKPMTHTNEPQTHTNEPQTHTNEPMTRTNDWVCIFAFTKKDPISGRYPFFTCPVGGY